MRALTGVKEQQVVCKQDPNWWIEMIKIAPSLILAVLAVAIVIAYHREVRMWQTLTSLNQSPSGAAR